MGESESDGFGGALGGGLGALLLIILVVLFVIYVILPWMRRRGESDAPYEGTEMASVPQPVGEGASEGPGEGYEGSGTVQLHTDY